MVNNQTSLLTRYGVRVHHWSALGAFLEIFFSLPIPILPFILPTLAYFVGGRDAFVTYHYRQAMRFQFFMYLYSIVAASGLVLMTAGVYANVFMPPEYAHKFLILWVTLRASIGALGLGAVYIVIMLSSVFVPLYAAHRAQKGQRYRYPLVFAQDSAA